MPKNQVSNFGNIIKILNISAVKMAKEINVEQSYISKWRTGKRNIPVDAPYFNQIIDYLIEKNNKIGGNLLEDFFRNIYENKKYFGKDELKKCIRDYILNISDKNNFNIDAIDLRNLSISLMSVAKNTGAEGRFNMVINLLEVAEKLTAPSVVKIFETDQFGWISCNIHHATTLYKKLNSVLRMGHSVEIIFQSKESSTVNWNLHHIFMELAFHQNMFIYIYLSAVGKSNINSIYLLSQRLAVTGYCFDSDFDNMLSCLYSDVQYTQVHERIWEKCKLESSPLLISTKSSEFEKILTHVNSFRLKAGSACYLGKALNIATMSKELFDEILCENRITKVQKRLCYELYDLLRQNIENNQLHVMTGFYHTLDEITAPLSFPVITNHTISGITGKLVQMSREQYLQHFKDTAQLLLKDSRYRVFLYDAPPHSIIPSTSQQSLWYKNDCWAIALGTDDISGKIKFSYVDDFRITNTFNMNFIDIFNRIPESKKDSTYVSQLFMKIANDQAI